MINKNSHRKTSSFSIIMLFVLFSIIGMAFIPFLNLSLLPSKTLPSINVRYNWYNTSAYVIENRVTAPLEALFSSIKGLEDIESKTTKSGGNISLYFNDDVNMDVAKFQVSSFIRRAYADFPENVTYPILTVNTPSGEKQSLLSFSIYSSTEAINILEYAQNYIKPEISNINGISEVDVYGASPFEWFVTYNPTVLKVFNITPNDIKNSIRNYFTGEDIGYATIQKNKNIKETIQVKVVSSVNNNSAFSKIPIKKINTRIIYLTDIAKITYKAKDPSSYHRINGMNTINIVVFAEDNVNSLKLVEKVNSKMANIVKNLPTGYSIRKTYDATIYIKKELHKVGIRTIIAVIVLLSFVFLINRKIKYLLVILISLLANILIASIFYYMLGIEINIYSLAGLTISLGIIIDNSIVMTDHIKNKGNSGVFLSILAATLTTIGSLSLVFVLNKEQQLNLSDFSLIIIINLGVSLFIALFFIPALIERIKLNSIPAKQFFRRKRLIARFNHYYVNWINLQLKYKWVFIIVLILIFGTPIYKLPQKIEKQNVAAKLYNNTFGSEWYSRKAKPIVDKCLGGTLRLFTDFVYESSYQSNPARTKLYVRGEMPEGSTIQQINAAVKSMENYLNKFNGIELFTTEIYSYRNARITIYFKEEENNSSFPYILKSELIAKANNLGGMDWSIYGVGRGFSNAVHSDYKDSKIQLLGYNYDKLYKYALLTKEKLSGNARVKSLEIRGNNSWFAEPLRNKIIVNLSEKQLAQLGFSYKEVFENLNTNTLQSSFIGKYFINGKQKNVNLEADIDNFDKWKLKNSPIGNNDKFIKFKDVGKIVKKKVGNDIYKKDQQYQLFVEFNFVGPPGLKKIVVENVINEMNSILPLGYKAQSPQYSFGEREKSKIGILILIIVIIFFICSILFESFKQPIVILSIIPISFIGAFLTFYLFDINFDQGGYASFILLAGITVNASIYIVNEYNNLVRDRKKSGIKIYLKAFNNKIIPIILTVVSTILGLMPFLFGSSNQVFWTAFAAGTIGGLVFTLLGVFIFIPVFFLKKKYINEF